MRTRIDLAPAWVLHTRAYRDTSLLVDLFTLDFGRLRCVARGVRGARSKKKNLLQPFQPLLVSLTGRGELLTLTHAEFATGNIHLTGRSLFNALYLNELLVRLLHPFESHSLLYRAYQEALLSLYGGEEEVALRWFEWQLLEELGYAINAGLEAHSGVDIAADEYYQFNPIAGFLRVPRPSAQQSVTVFHGEELLALQCYMDFRRRRSLAWPAESPAPDPEPVFDAALATSAKRLMRQALRPLLGERPLMTRTLFRQHLPTIGLPPSSGDGCLPPKANKR